MRKISLNGEYLLRYCDQQQNAKGLNGMASVPVTVPGNVEIDLMRAGVLPDIFFGNNVKLLKPYEFYRWRYERSFEAPEVAPGERVYLHFQGVDCFATYYLNGEKFAESDNALIAHRFEVTGLLKPGVNQLAVELSSPMLAGGGPSLRRLQHPPGHQLRIAPGAQSPLLLRLGHHAPHAVRRALAGRGPGDRRRPTRSRTCSFRCAPCIKTARF